MSIVPVDKCRSAALRRVLRSVSISTLSRHLRVSPAAISQWRDVPPERVDDVARVSALPRHLIRPDLYRPS